MSSGGASFVAKLVGDHQKLWADATQKRITTTSSMLRDMSGLKMMGLADFVGEIVQDERIRETKQMESWAWINTWKNVIGK
jgi:ATP-binding cassette subfamily C (CFTR/MRP) protein 1